MHILYIHQYFCHPSGSGNNRSLELARNWVRAGNRVTMLTTQTNFPADQRSAETQRINIDGIAVIALHVPYSHMMKTTARVRAWISFYRKALALRDKLTIPDIIYASSTPPSVGEIGRKLSRRWNRPFIYECVDVWPDVPVGMGIIRNKTLIDFLNEKTGRIYNEAAHIVALSEGMKAQICSHGVPAHQVMVSHNGTNINQFMPVEREGREEVHFLYAGTVGLANGLDQLVVAAKRMQEMDLPPFRIRVLGQGNDWLRVRELADAAGVKCMEFLPSVPKAEVSRYFDRADVGIVCFAPFQVLEANSANKFYDYLASGLPVALNYEGWQKAYVDEWECGLTSPQGDVEAFAANMAALARQPRMRLAMGKKARELAVKKFSRDEIAAAVLSLLRLYA